MSRRSPWIVLSGLYLGGLGGLSLLGASAMISPSWSYPQPQQPLLLSQNQLQGPPSLVPLPLPAPASTAQSLSLRVLPASPQLGDTLSVRITGSALTSTPTVNMTNVDFPAYANGDGSYTALIPTSPLYRAGGYEIRVTANGQQQTASLSLRDRSFPTQSITVRGGGSNATQYELDRVAAFKEIVTPERFWRGEFLRPSQGRVSSIYGVRRYYNGVFAENYYHRGVDYAAGLGTPIVSPAAGRIALVGREVEGFAIHGNTVGVDHGQGVTSIFLHMNAISVAEGQMVSAGQQLGTIGTTGSSTGPHVHWGLFLHGVAVDPVPWRHGGITVN